MAARWHVRLVLVAFVAARSESNVTLSANDTTRECFTPTVACAYSEAAPRLVRVVAGILGSRGAIPGGDAAVTGDLSGDGSPATATRLRTPRSVAVDVRARALYVVDQDDSAVRRVDLLTGHLSLLSGIRTPTELELGTGQISMLVGTRGSAGPEGDKGHPNLAQLRSPMGVAVDTISQTLYIADTGNHVVRMLDLSTGDMVVVAGIAGRGGFCGESGLATETCLRFPRAVAVDAVARELYVADTHNHVVRLINLTSGDISTLAGTPRYGGRRTGTTGVATSAQLFFPNDVAVDPVWRQLFIADTNNHAIRLVDLATGMLSTIAGVFGVYGYSGDGGLGAAAHFNMPDSVTVDPAARQLYVADTQNHVVRRVDLWTGKVFTIAGVPTYPGLVDEGGPATAARLYLPTGISVEWDPQAMQRLIVNPPEHARTYSSSASSNTGSMLHGSQAWLGIERGPNSTEWMQVDLEIVRIVTGIIVQGQAGLHSDQGVTSVEVWHSTDNASWSAVPANLTRRTPLSAEEQLVFPRPVQARHIRFLAKGWNGQIAMRAGVEVIDFMQARLLYVADSNNYVARVVDLASHAMSTIVGLLGTYGNGTLDGSLAAASSLHQPRGVAVDSMRKLLYVADTSNHVIRRVDLTSGVLSTPVGVVQQAGALGDGGPATSAELHLPYGVAVDPVAQKLYVADTGNHAVRVYSTEDSGLALAGCVARGWHQLPTPNVAMRCLFWPYALLFLQAAQSSSSWQALRAGGRRSRDAGGRAVRARSRANVVEPSDEQLPDCGCDCCVVKEAAAVDHTSTLQCLPRAGAPGVADGGCSITCLLPEDLRSSFQTRTGELDTSRYCSAQCRPAGTQLNELCVSPADLGEDTAAEADGSDSRSAPESTPKVFEAPAAEQVMSQVGSHLLSKSQGASDGTAGAASDSTSLVLAKGEMLLAKQQAEMAGKAARLAREAYERELISARAEAEHAAQATLDEIKAGAAKTSRRAWDIRMKYVKDAQAKAAKAAVAAALPYKKALVRDTGIAAVWSERAGQLATAATQREDMATGFEADAEFYRKNNDQQMAKQSVLQAQQALDQASAFQADADAASEQADKIKKSLPWYTWAEEAMAKTILAKSMPYDVVPPLMPPLP